MPVSLVLVAALAAAVDPPDDILVTWEAPAECPPAEVLRARIRRSLAGLAIAGVHAAVRIEREAARRYRLELVIDVGDGPGERTLVAEGCEAAIDTAAWLIAVALDSRAAEPSGAADAPQGPAPVQVPAPPATVPVPPGPATTAEGTRSGAVTGPAAGAMRSGAGVTGPGAGVTGSGAGATGSGAMRSGAGATGSGAGVRSGAGATAARALHVDLWVGGGLGLGVLPAATGVASGGLALSGPRWQVELGGQYWARRSVMFEGEVGGRFAQGQASLRGCAGWEVGPARFSPCGGLALGGLTAAGTGPVVSRTARSLWVGLLVGAQVWLRLHARVRLGLQGDAVLGLRRPGFTLEPEGKLLFRPGVVGFSGLVALLIRLR